MVAGLYGNLTLNSLFQISNPPQSAPPHGKFAPSKLAPGPGTNLPILASPYKESFPPEAGDKFVLLGP